MANQISPILLQLMAEGPQGIAAQNALTQNQAAAAGANAQATQAQVPLTQAQTQNVQADAQLKQQQIAAAQGIAQTYGQAYQASALPGTKGAAPAAGQTSPIQALKTVFLNLSKPKKAPSGGGAPPAPDEDEE